MQVDNPPPGRVDDSVQQYAAVSGTTDKISYTVTTGKNLFIQQWHVSVSEGKKNIFELNKEQAEEWMKGRELGIKTGKRGFLVMKYKDDFLGTGKASEEKIGNFIPKSRRLKNREN